MAAFTAQLRALLKKDWILWKRNWCGSCCEIFIPLLFALIIIFFRGRIPISDVPEQVWVPTTNYSLPANHPQQIGSNRAVPKLT